MKIVMVRYKVKPESAEENRRHIGRVFEELGRSRPGGLRYASFCLPDGVSFVHFASLSGDGGNPLMGISAFQEFLAGINSRCDEPPVAVELNKVGDYGWIGG